MSQADKAPLTVFLKPAFAATLFSVFLGSVLTLLPIPYLWLSLVVLVVSIWLCVKVAQTAVAHFLECEYASSTIFWFLITSQIIGGLLALAVVSLFFSVAGISGPVATAGSLSNTAVLALTCLLPITLAFAILLRSTFGWVVAWRPLSAYWRPFYDGVKLPRGYKKASTSPETFVESIVVQNDSKILVAGRVAEGEPGFLARYALVRLNPNGSLDTTFGDPSANLDIYAIALQEDGKILMGGHFTQVASQERNSLARLNIDGSLDAGFSPNPQHDVWSIVAQDDGKVVIGGFFSKVGGHTQKAVARLNADGTLDVTFKPSLDGGVTSVALQDDGKFLIRGHFAPVGSQERNCLARLNVDGSLDDTFSDPADCDDTFANPNIGQLSHYGTNEISSRAVALQDDGKALISSIFTQVDGQVRPSIVRLNSDGSLDDTFSDPNIGKFGADALRPVVNSIAVQDDGKVIIAGSFSRVGEHAQKAVARLNADGTFDATFRPSLDGGVRSVALQDDGNVIISGYFTRVDGQEQKGMARLGSDGRLDRSFHISL